ncbi:ROK family protein [Roseimaritima ulvae]|uniref:Glucokinase n=1 Tax=Roseimaritima ulvae TaxID=980254 RepID=A0A5B9QQU2_9BACT|nr:ROK family protein [Roseimaritima ulvae]QEG40020.1 Glucokinase [Roseimaritima ulvae]
MSEHLPLIDIKDAQEPLFWGVDIGGTNIKMGLVDDTGETLAFERIATEESQGPQSAVDRMAQTIRKIEQKLQLSPAQIPRVGLGSPGSMDLPKGMLVEPPNLPSWWQFPIRDALRTAVDRPVSFINDANAAAYGEYWLGTGQQNDSMILLTLGTGVGGGIIVNGELVNGVNSFGSECGHILVNTAADAQLCVWGGGRGQLEAYASASAVVQRTRQRLTEGAESQLSGLLGGGNSELTAKKVYQAAEAGDALALEIIDETARWLGIGITTLVHTLDPGLVVLGGAMNFGGSASAVGRRFLEAVREEFRSRTFDNVYAGTRLDFASLGGAAGYLGAAGYARRQYHPHPIPTN